MVTVAQRRLRVGALLTALLLLTGTAAPAGAATDAPTTSAVPAAAAKRALYVDPDTLAASARRAALRAGDASLAARLKVISSAPQARWFGTWNSPSTVRADVRSYVRAARKADAVPQLVLYAIPGRDCGGHSSGGFTAAAYRGWVRQVAAGLKGSGALVVLEPDALSLDCGGSQRAKLLAYAVGRLSAAGALVYIDAGHSGWHTPTETAERLKAAGVAKARGFATNVSNFRSTKAERAYATKVSAALAKRGVGAKHRHFVIDTSRNGRATAGAEWCNPPGQGLGVRPRWVGGKQLDAYLWVKRPGESDGPCHGLPAAGQWSTSYALGLVARRAR